MADVPLILGVDGGNSKTELVVATLDGEPVAYLRGPGRNSHTEGPTRTAAFLSGLAARAGLTAPVVQGTFYLCGADIPADFLALAEALEQEPWLERAAVENDIFALLRAGTDDANAVAVVCGAGVNCAGRASDGRVARYPSLGWESGDWGGSVMLGRDVLSLAARAEDGRGEPTALADVLREHFDLPVDELGEAVLRPHRAGPPRGGCACGRGSGRGLRRFCSAAACCEADGDCSTNRRWRGSQAARRTPRPSPSPLRSGQRWTRSTRRARRLQRRRASVPRSTWGCR